MFPIISLLNKPYSVVAFFATTYYYLFLSLKLIYLTFCYWI
nr:MAG TPA: hypothetical protein [Caudoviricetes sp.]